MRTAFLQGICVDVLNLVAFGTEIEDGGGVGTDVGRTEKDEEGIGTQRRREEKMQGEAGSWRPVSSGIYAPRKGE